MKWKIIWNLIHKNIIFKYLGKLKLKNNYQNHKFKILIDNYKIKKMKINH